jgi:hypothetical protein
MVVKFKGGPLSTEVYSSVACVGQHVIKVLASMASSSQPLEYVTVGMNEEQTRAAIEKSREQGWSELKEGAQAATVVQSLSAQDGLIWEEMKRRDPCIFKENVELELGRLIAEGGQAHIYKAQIGLLQ